MLKNKKGITLVALVVTIVVLLILAGVALNLVIGENGLIAKARDTKTLTGRASVIEQAQTDVLGYQVENKSGDLEKSQLKSVLDKYFKDVPDLTDMEKNAILSTEVETLSKYGTYTIKVSEIYDGNIISDEDKLPEITASTPAGTQVKITNENWTNTNITAISDGNGNAIPLPAGFYYVGGTLNTGLVISDKENDTLDASGISSGNQFVYIPVVSESDLTRTNFNTSTGNPITGLNSNYTEPCGYGYFTETSEFNTMKTQVLKYGGFYIGRFEAGVNSTTLRTKVTTDETVVCKKGVAPYNYIPWGASMSAVDTSFRPTNNNGDNISTHGAVDLSKYMYSDSDSVTSTLCYGCQWDAMCRYIGDNNRTTPSKNALELTGSVGTDVSKNIYDLAGNCTEWTMEAFSQSSRVYRGSNFRGSQALSIRNYDTPSVNYDGCSFRISLYIK